MKVTEHLQQGVKVAELTATLAPAMHPALLLEQLPNELIFEGGHDEMGWASLVTFGADVPFDDVASPCAFDEYAHACARPSSHH